MKIFSLNSKNSLFCLFLAHGPNFWSQKGLFQKHLLCHAQIHKGFQHHAKFQKIVMIQFQENAWRDSKTEERTLFHRILPATTRGLANTTAVDWHLKVKNIEYNDGLTKNCCITFSMQKITSIHTLILKIQQI